MYAKFVQLEGGGQLPPLNIFFFVTKTTCVIRTKLCSNEQNLVINIL